MVFKLLRIDATDARKIPLVVGKHLIGRGSGKLLQCDDKRVSRQHGELEVTDNSLTLKALHTNPCFYVRKGTVDRQMLKQNESVTLGNCDKFGLLPADCWYEILYLPDSDIDKDKGRPETTGQISETNRTTMLDSTEVNTEALVNRTVVSPSLAPQSPSEDKIDEPHIDDRPFSPNVSDQSQSLLQNGDLPSTSVSDPLPLLQSDQPQTSDQTSNSVEHQPMKFKIEPADWDSAQPSSMKRQLPSTSDVKTEPSEEGKRIKTESDDASNPGSSAQNEVNHCRTELRLGSTESSRTSIADEIISKINSHVNGIVPSDRWDHVAKSWAGVMRSLRKDQQIFAEKLVNDVLFEAQLNSLCRQSRVDARLPSASIDLTDF